MATKMQLFKPSKKELEFNLQLEMVLVVRCLLRRQVQIKSSYLCENRQFTFDECAAMLPTAEHRTRC